VAIPEKVDIFKEADARGFGGDRIEFGIVAP
jgi:hypothetical protein